MKYCSFRPLATWSRTWRCTQEAAPRSACAARSSKRLSLDPGEITDTTDRTKTARRPQENLPLRQAMAHDALPLQGLVAGPLGNLATTADH